ncbi:hypothetical protein ACH4U7_38550 [Streptomyces sp. NPDC020845]|uniref:hypothetical protein n=1 Tax=Streptomyces sp. NPDC020845 TaxID=3365096 RepID=UPI0037A90F7E
MGVDAGGDANVGVAPLIMSRICSSVGTVRCAALALISCGWAAVLSASAWLI